MVGGRVNRAHTATLVREKQAEPMGWKVIAFIYPASLSPFSSDTRTPPSHVKSFQAFGVGFTSR